MTYVRSLGFVDKPDYNYLRSLMRAVVDKHPGDTFEWVRCGKQKTIESNAATCRFYHPPRSHCRRAGQWQSIRTCDFAVRFVLYYTESLCPHCSPSELLPVPADCVVASIRAVTTSTARNLSAMITAARRCSCVYAVDLYESQTDLAAFGGTQPPGRW